MKDIMLSIGESTSCPSLSEQISKLFKIDNELCVSQENNSLHEKCVQVLATNFTTRPFLLSKLIPETANKLTSKLPYELDFQIAVQYIESENFWKKRYIQEYGEGNFRIEEHGLTWKRLCVERHIQALLEHFDPKLDDLEALLSTVISAQDFVFTLRFRQLPSHMMLNKVCDLLTNLTKLEIQYGAIDLSMNYESKFFGMRLEDTDGLGKAISNMWCLTSLVLSGNRINDDILRELVKTMRSNYLNTLINLDLSHNKITTNGFRFLANKVLDADSVLCYLNVADNRIHAEGGRCLGRLLRFNKSLTHLNIKLNRLEDVGGRMILDGLNENFSLKALDISSNGLGSESMKVLVSVLLNSKPQGGLSFLDVSSNFFDRVDVSTLQMALKRNKAIQSLDVRMNSSSDISKQDEEIDEKIMGICVRNEFTTGHSTE